MYILLIFQSVFIPQCKVKQSKSYIKRSDQLIAYYKLNSELSHVQNYVACLETGKLCNSTIMGSREHSESVYPVLLKQFTKNSHTAVCIIAMSNTLKYFELLNNLLFDSEFKKRRGCADAKPTNHETSRQNLTTSQRLAQNLEVIRRIIKTDVNTILQTLSVRLNLKCDNLQLDENADTSTDAYIVYMLYVLHMLAEDANFDSDAREDLISMQHKNLYIDAVRDTAVHALGHNLHSAFYKSNVFKMYENERAPNLTILHVSVECFTKLLTIRALHVANSMELVVRDFMAAIYTLKVLQSSTDGEQLIRTKLDFVWSHLTKLEYFRNLMLFKATPRLPELLQKMIHQDLLQRLISKDGFLTLVATIKSSQSADKQYEIYEVISKIAAHPGYSKRFQQKMIQQVFAYCQTRVKTDGMLESIGAGLLTIRKLYDLNDENKNSIVNIIQSYLKPLIDPEDILTGLIVMDYAEFSARISLLYQLFCTSIVACLPSGLIVNYLPLLLHVYESLPETNSELQRLRFLITRCLDNRDTKDELYLIIEKLLTGNYDSTWKLLHPRIIIVSNEASSALTLKFASSEYKPDFSASLILPSLLMTSDHNVLTYKVFMILLRLMTKNMAQDSSEMSSIELISNETELVEFLNSKYPVKVDILLSLNTLISHEPLKSQLKENSKDFMDFLEQFLKQRLELSLNVEDITESADHTLLILLTLLQELIEQSNGIEVGRKLLPLLAKVRAKSPNQLVQRRLDVLESLIDDGKNRVNTSYDMNPFQAARNLIESKESHLQVYGIEMFLKLLHDKDAATMSQGHLILALALSTLRSKESYSFLNCVRLFVALLAVMEAEVLDVLEGEYLSETVETDFRLVVGEAILKVAKELGVGCYKYKAKLFNCFLNGVRSTTDEFRMSAYSNLAQICRVLNYQVDNFFQELMHLIDVELTSGKYLPSKRAAVFVLSELLESMENLVDFGDKLLPIYRLLRAIESSEDCDPKMHQHAANGLRTLNEKCKELIFREQQLQKEIRILGVKDKPNRRLSQHILEIN